MDHSPNQFKVLKPKSHSAKNRNGFYKPNLMTQLEVLIFRIKQELNIFEEPKLNHVLLFHQTKQNKHSHFEVFEKEGHFIVYEGDEGSENLTWDLTKNDLKDQNENLINWLNTLR